MPHMGKNLVVAVHLHDRYHGTALGAPEWPPSPARVFQALVAGVARGSLLPQRAADAFEWLETLAPPIIAAPRARLGSPVVLYVPNNDADSLTDPLDVSAVRTKKQTHPRILEDELPVLYLWKLPAESEHVRTIAEAANEIYQLGRGIDLAWAIADVVDDDTLEQHLEEYGGTVHLPDANGRGLPLACPAPGSLAGLVRRHRATRFRTGEKGAILYNNAPKPSFVSVAFERAHRLSVYELRDLHHDQLRPWPLRRVGLLVVKIRDAAAQRLRTALPSSEGSIERTIIGRRTDPQQRVRAQDRIRIIPLPSIGHPHADRAVRRVAIDVPTGTPLPATDVEWSFSGLELSSFILTRTDDTRMLEHYLKSSSSSGATRWHSVTAVALPEDAKRRRIEPARKWQERKSAVERAAEEERAVQAVRSALRHAGVRAKLVEARVQREPFDGRGVRAEEFAENTRFAKERLWHVEIVLDRPIEGPLVIGDGRFLGLGVMAPAHTPTPSMASGFYASAAMRAGSVDGVTVARAMRNAIMAKVQEQLGPRRLPSFFSGHDVDGAPARSSLSSHIAVHWDPVAKRIIVIAPHCLDHREPTREERRYLRILENALEEIVELRAGSAGRLSLVRQALLPTEALLGHARVWSSIQPYTVTRHRKGAVAHDILGDDAIAECRRRGLPTPSIEVLDARGIPGRGLQGRMRLTFDVAVEGPLVLGRTRYLGGGLFARVSEGRART